MATMIRIERPKKGQNDILYRILRETIPRLQQSESSIFEKMWSGFWPP